MLYVIRLRAIVLFITALLLMAFAAAPVHAAKIKMVFPGPVRTF
jgi:hypothetical protein